MLLEYPIEGVPLKKEGKENHMHRWYDHFEGEGETKTDDVYECVVYPTLPLLSAGQKHIFLTRHLQ